MQMIRRAFNPASGNARAACVDIGNYAVGLIIKGDDADAIVAQFEALAPTIDLSANWNALSDLFDALDTTSPAMMFCRHKSNNRYSAASKKCYYKNLGESPYTKAKMIGLCADMQLVKPAILHKAASVIGGMACGDSVVLLSTATYDKEHDFEPLSKALTDAFVTLCKEVPEEHFDGAGEVLRSVLGEGNAYILIVDAEECCRRLFWNMTEGEPTEHRLKIDWRKKGREIGYKYDEQRSDVVNARTGVLEYEGFIGLCITEITAERIVLQRFDDRYILTPGECLELRDGDSREDSEGVELYDINYCLSLEWTKG